MSDYDSFGTYPYLTPTEMGRELGMHRREVIAKCMEWGVPIFEGRINLGAMQRAQAEAQSNRRSFRWLKT